MTIGHPVSVFRMALLLAAACSVSTAQADDFLAGLQKAAIAADSADWGWWGTDPSRYTQWRSHSNRLIPVYTYGTGQMAGPANLNSYCGENSPYRTEAGVRRLYGRVPERTVHPDASWLDQTCLAELQRAAAAAGKKYIFVVLFDGLDWQTVRAAAVYNEHRVSWHSGRGTGTHFQNDDAHGTSQFHFMVTSPHNRGTSTDVDTQTVDNPGGSRGGGYDPEAGGFTPWDTPSDPGYLIGRPQPPHVRHAIADSASSATALMTGVKTYSGAINVGPTGDRLTTVAHQLQESGWAVGVVTSVPISHATPAAAYAHNVSRSDNQDIARDLLGLPSVAHPDQPLPGMDVVIGGGFGVISDRRESQGQNFEPGHVYLADSDLKRVAVENGGRYVTAVRKAGQSGRDLLQKAAARAASDGHRLLGFFGVGDYGGHLPFQTADGDYRPVPGNRKKAERYSAADLLENPTLEDMTSAALTVLSGTEGPFWLLVEAGDVDWANHDNNLDNSIGAVNSGDAAVRRITDWVERHSNWDESLMIVTGDHGHLLHLERPEKLAGSP